MSIRGHDQILASMQTLGHRSDQQHVDSTASWYNQLAAGLGDEAQDSKRCSSLPNGLLREHVLLRMQIWPERCVSLRRTWV